MAVDKNTLKPLGNVVGETTHAEIVFTANRAPRVGEYVFVEYPGDDMVLAMVEESRIGNPALLYQGIRPEYVEKAQRLSLDRTEYTLGEARLLGWLKPLLDRHELQTPKYPPKPGARVYEASPDVLRGIFVRSPGEGWVRIGRLVNHPDVPVYVNVNAAVSRHMAILAVTGAGKSNTVGVLVERIVEDLGGTVLLVDMHNEYSGVAGSLTKTVEPRINPARLTIYEYYRLLGLDPQATKQRMYLRKAIRALRQKGVPFKTPEKFLDELASVLEGYMASYKQDSRSIADLINKLEELRARYENRVLTPEAPLLLEDIIEPGKANVIALGSVDEEVADVVTYHYLSWLLGERKNKVMTGSGYPVPVLVVIEEAHILIPRDDETLTKEIAARIAREGRKFGVGLCLVSQRPKNIDEDALSQTNNKIILRLVEPNDQRYVQRASELLSEELLKLLPGLNIGEAVIIGLMTPLPALVKIDKATHKPGGGDIPVHREWMEWRRRLETMEDEADIYDPYT